jgi:cytochrome o ubiquinol oxidase subunit 3
MAHEQVHRGFHDPDIHLERALGFWFYLIGDAVLFAVLFANYAVLLHGTAGGPVGIDIFTMWRVLAQTTLLLLSSLSFGFMSYAATGHNKAMASFWLLVTMFFGLAFIVLEIGEFSEMAALGATPQRSGFLSGFTALVGTHGTHVSFGLLMLTVLFFQIRAKGLTAPVLSRLYRLGLFWHFLDIVWIGIFSFVYLPGMLP